MARKAQQATEREPDHLMLRWTGALAVLSLLTGLLATGLIPNQAFGLTSILFGVFTGLLAASLLVGILRP